MKKVFTVNGMKCEHCKAHVENALNTLNGVASVVVSLADHQVSVDYDASKVTPEQKLLTVLGTTRWNAE